MFKLFNVNYSLVLINYFLLFTLTFKVSIKWVFYTYFHSITSLIMAMPHQIENSVVPLSDDSLPVYIYNINRISINTNHVNNSFNIQIVNNNGDSTAEEDGDSAAEEDYCEALFIKMSSNFSFKKLFLPLLFTIPPGLYYFFKWFKHT